MSVELSEVRSGVEESVQLLGRVPSPLLEQVIPVQSIPTDIQVLEDTLSQKQWSRAVQLLRAIRYVSFPPSNISDRDCILKYRRHKRDIEVFGGSEDDDVDCLFFLYARFLTDNQEGMIPL